MCVTVYRQFPRVSDWSLCTRPGYQVPPDLATMPPSFLYVWCTLMGPTTSDWMFQMMSLAPWCKTCHYSVTEWHHRSFIRPDPVGETVLWLPSTKWTVSRNCPAVCSSGPIPDVLTVYFYKLNGVLVVLWLITTGITVHQYRDNTFGTIQRLTLFSIVYTVMPN